MYRFKVCTNDSTKYFQHVSYVVTYIKTANLTDYEIYWKTPVTGEYRKIIEVENGVRTYTNTGLELPKAFEGLGK